MPDMHTASDKPGLVGRDHFIRQGLKLQHLRLIAALRDTGQMSAAALQLAISQPAASRLCAEMEEILGVPLHRRHPRGVALTAYGEAFALRAVAMLRGLDDAAREIGEMTVGRQGTVSIGAVTAPALELVLPAVRQARVTHPGISAELTVDTSDRLAEALLAARLDFYLGRILGDVDLKLFETREIGTEPISLIVRDDHPLTRRDAIALEDCIVFDWVFQARGALLRRTVETYLLARGVGLPAKIVSTSSLLLTLAIVCGSNAVAPVSSAVADFVIGKQGLNGRIVRLATAPDLTVGPYSMVVRAGHALSPASQILFDSIVRMAAAGEPS